MHICILQMLYLHKSYIIISITNRKQVKKRFTTYIHMCTNY